ncbi:hypothetical protein [Brevundimonas sp.]|uniref:hypothetical protein n=1 Tax=Brevundimonas sp. TaxID=1871086 RepID=UPI0028989A60|nr:hypothetical protein [Brevundimonas sp.]
MDAPTNVDTDGYADADPDDMEFIEKLADNVGVALTMGYASPIGGESERSVNVDGVFGDTLMAPKFLRGLDSKTGERRTFRFDRIVWLRLANGAIVRENPAWFATALVRKALQLEVSLPPLKVETPLRLVITAGPESHPSELSGTLEEAVVDPRSYGVRAWLKLRPDRPFNGSRRVQRFSLLPDQPGHPLYSIREEEDGEDIEDVYAWLAALCGRDSNGWPLAPVDDRVNGLNL